MNDSKCMKCIEEPNPFKRATQNVGALTCGFPAFRGSHHGHFDWHAGVGLGLPQVLQGICNKHFAILHRCKKVDVLVEDERLCAAEWPRQRVHQLAFVVLLQKEKLDGVNMKSIFFFN